MFVRLVLACALASMSLSLAEAQGPRERLTALRAAATVPAGALDSIQHLLDTADRIEDRFEEPAAAWRRRATRYLTQAEGGVDPYPLAKGEIVNRGYRSEISTVLQGYAVYLPPDYDPSQTYPLYVALHGGSSNGNLFLGVVLGNNMDWLTYDQHLYDDYTPRWSPDWIVVAPTGFGQIMWRWMGEQDVLDVIDDVQAHYSVDPDRVVLGGLSNGGVGAYAIGARHASRFAVVQAMAGAPSWQQYLGGRGRLRDVERTEVPRYSGIHLARNYNNTDFRYYHGTTDTGPMRPAYVREFTTALQRAGVEADENWYEMGHDILYRVHRHGRVYDGLETRRDRSPREVTVVTGDYRASRQHWVDVTRIDVFPELATVHAVADDAAGTLTVTTENTRAFSIDLRDAPLRGPTQITIDGAAVYRGEAAALGQVAHFVRRPGANTWAAGFPDDAGMHKKPGLSGPITDAYYERMVHVYGTQNAEHTDALRDAAERGARGWPLWSWDLRQEVMADTELDIETMQNAHVVLYASPGDNAVLERIAGALPIRLEANAVVVGETRHTGNDVGVRFVYPNPLAPQRYVIVQAGVTPEVVGRGNKLPEFVCDYIVYNRRTIPTRQARVQARNRAVAQGYFDSRWRLPGAPETAANEGSGPDDQVGGTGETVAEVEPSLPVPPSPPVPAPPGRYGVRSSDPAGRAARAIWARVPTFHNYRAETAGANWRVDRRADWSIRAQEECYSALREAGVPFRPALQPSRIVPSPVELLGPIEGVWWRMTHEERPFLTSCEMALRLPELMRVLKEHGVHGVEILSSYRNHPTTSFHTMGLALDLNRFWTDEGWLSVYSHYEATPMQETCTGPARGDRRARALRAIACDLVATRLLSSVLTPNYNEGHRDHFHIDARPNDPRIFLR